VTVGRRLAKWVVSHTPLPLLLHPFEVFLAFLCVISGLPMLLQVTPRPNSLEALLPAWLVFTWGVILVSGGLLTLVGTVRRSEPWERSGVGVLGFASVAYSIAIFLAVGVGGSVAGAIVLAFGLACWFRYLTLTEAKRVRDRESS
jgi:hypothetical protein